jgi:2-C-methyl-D-erythritol 2,4-cyclodiphosphate synthase
MSEVPDATPRIGLGYDRHRMVEGRRCVIGGIVIPHDRGPLGHSDGDVLLHAAIDAVLGAAGLDDIGTLFPDRDPRYAGADSQDLCREAQRLVAAAGLRVVSLDAVVVAEAPRLAPHRPAMRARLGELFDVPEGRVNVKGKSGEGVGPEGRGELIEATVVALLAPR